jgi:hypothetical protein
MITNELIFRLIVLEGYFGKFEFGMTKGRQMFWKRLYMVRMLSISGRRTPLGYKTNFFGREEVRNGFFYDRARPRRNHCGFNLFDLSWNCFGNDKTHRLGNLCPTCDR